MKDDSDRIKAEILGLNKQFYENFNPKYFTQKVSFLLALLSDTKYLSKIYEQGIEIGDIKAKGKALTSEEEKHLQELLKTEISLIYYHTIETFFRLFIAHTFKTECPWVEISSLTSYSAFKKEVERIQLGQFPSKKDDLKIIIAGVMFGAIPPEKSGIPKDKWNKNLNNLVDWINLFAGDLLKNEDYNAYKHGLGIFTTQLGFQLGNSLVKREKDGVLGYITQKREGKTINYFKTYKFIDWQQKTALIFKISQMIENIIVVGKGRYLKNGERVKIHLFDDIRLVDVFKEGIRTTEISMELPFARQLK